MKKMTITGNVGRDAEVRVNTQTGNEFASFSVAVNVGTKDKPRTDWIEVVCNNKLAVVAKHHVKKGGKVLVEGFPTAYAYNQDGVLHAKIRIAAQHLELLGRKTEGEDESQAFSTAPVEDEIPAF